MALVHNVNVVVTTGAGSIFNLLTTLLAAGWTVPSSSDGTTYNSSGNQIASASSGANGLDNNNAWFRVRDPGGRREYVFQRGLNSGAWRVTFSELTRFIIGSPTATVVPSATDSQSLIGTGTDAAPTFSALWLDAVATGKTHCVAENAAAGNAYWFWMTQTAAGSGALRSFLIVDAMQVGSYPVADVSPVGHRSNVALGATMSATLAATGIGYWVRYGLPGALWKTLVAVAAPVAGAIGPFGLATAGGVNDYTGNDDLVDVFWCTVAVASIGGYKGRSSCIKASSIIRTFPSSSNIASATDSAAYFGTGYALRWPTGVTPLV
jgi:hypothetical protein